MRLLSDEDEPTNKFYSPEVAKLILNHFMPFVIMTTAILFADLLPEVSRLSNAYVEAHFKTIKDTVLRNETHLPIARFIRNMKRNSIRKSRKMNLPIQNVTKLKQFQLP